MKKLFFTFLMLSPCATPFLNAYERVLTLDTSVKEYLEKDALNSVYVAWLVPKNGKLIEPEIPFPECRGYGILHGMDIPDNAAYGIFTTFPIEKPEQVLSLINDNGNLKHEGVVTEPTKSKVFQNMLTITPSQNYKARTQRNIYDPNGPKHVESERIKQELLTIYKIKNITKNKRLKICLRIQNNLGKESLGVSETETN
jgi:hypothetical protein